jgi:hypothetical protein
VTALRVYWWAVTSSAPTGPRRCSSTLLDRSVELAEAQAERRARAQGLLDPLDVYVDDIGSSDDTELDRELNPWIYEDRK